MDTLNLSLAERASVFLLAARDNSSAADSGAKLEKYFSSRDEREAFPWKRDEKRALLQVERMQEAVADRSASADIEKEFVRAAKNSLLSPAEVLTGQYLIFGDATDGPLSLLHLLLRVPANQRIAVHNWSLAQMMPKATKEAYGNEIAKLTVPLFPPKSDELAALNIKLLSSVCDSMVATGGGNTKHAQQALFRIDANDIFNSEYGPSAAVAPRGAGILPVQLTPDGHAYVETSPLEQFIDDTYSRRSRGRAGGRGTTRPQQRVQQPSQLTQQEPRTKYYRGRGRGSSGGDVLDDWVPPTAPTQNAAKNE